MRVAQPAEMVLLCTIGKMKRLLLAILLALPLRLAAEELKNAVDTVIMVDNVNVTAIKQGNIGRNAPVTATLLTAADLERNGITALKEASLVAPNFYIPDYGSRMTSSVYVRGLGARIDQPVIGMNIDNVPVMNKEAYDFELADVERIEILRGPQSTLYGRNTMGGVVNVYTLSPFTYEGIRIGAEYGSGNTVKARISVYNTPTQRFGTSVAAYYSQTDGFYRNLYDDSACDWERMGGGRFKLQWRDLRDTRIDNTLAFSITRQGGYPYAYAGEDIVENGESVIANGEIRYNDPCGYSRTTLSDGITVRHDAERFTVASITSYQYLDDEMILDQDFMPLSYFTLQQKRREHSVTEDLVFKSRSTGRYRWLAGLFAFYRHGKMHAPVRFKQTGIERLIIGNIPDGMPTPTFTSDELLFDSRFTMPSFGVAAYHESTVLLGKFELTAGIRFDFEHDRLRYDCMSDAQGTFGTTAIEPFEHNGLLRKSFFEVLPKLTATFRIDARNSVYASISRGYKAGGFNTQMFSEVLQSLLMAQMGVYWSRDFDIDKVVAYKPEHSWNFEIGAHAASSDGRFAADAALFYIDCRDQQLTVFPEGQTTGRMMTNAGRSRSFGAEISSRILPFENFELSLSYGYTNARFLEFTSGRNDYAGRIVPYAPQHTVSARASYYVEIGARWLERIGFNVGYKGLGRIYWNEDNSLWQPFYSLLDCSVSFVQRHWKVEVWGRNLTGTRYDVFHFESISHPFLQRGRPRTFGVTLSVNL